MAIEASNYVYIATGAALFGAICMGVAIGFSSPALETLLQKSNSNSTDRIAADNDKSLIAASLTVGALVGSLVGGPLAEFAGRKKALIVYGIMFSIGCLVIFFAKSVFIVVIGRVITGIVAGLIAVATPMYVSEISTPTTRGLLGAGFQLFVNIGILLMAFFGIFGTVSFDYFFSWRYLALFGILPALLLSASMFAMPESPSWLMAKYGASSVESQSALTTLRTSKSDIKGEMDELEKQANQAKSMRLSAAEFKRPEYWKPAVFGMALMAFQQLSGINIVMFFQSQILKDSRGTNGVTESELSQYAAIGATIVCLTQVLATCVGAFLMDRLGRRKLLIASGMGHAIALSVLGYYFFSRHPVTTTANATTALVTKLPKTAVPQTSPLPSFLPVACLVFFVIAFSIGYGPISWLMIPELAPLAIRGLVSSLATGVSWSGAFITSFTFSPLSDAIGVSTTFWFYAVMCILSCVFVFLCLPETKGKSIDEIQRELAGTATTALTPLSSPAQLRKSPSVTSSTGVSSAVTSMPTTIGKASA